MLSKTSYNFTVLLIGIFLIFNVTTCDTEPAIPPVITIIEEPVATTNVIAGNINVSLTVTSSATQGASLSYQWFSSTTNSNTEGTIITGAINASFAIPTTLSAGTYYYFVEVRASGAVPERSSVAKVIVGKANGATLSAPTLNGTPTNNSITINAVSAPSTGQNVEYGINISNNANTATWQTMLTFNGLNENTTYYIFARTVGNNNYETGTASNALTVTTQLAISESIFEYFWVNEHGNLVQQVAVILRFQQVQF